LNTGALCRPLLERIENDPGLLVVCGNFEQLGVTHPREHDLVIEEQRPRIGGVHQPSLKACVGEDEELRIDRKLQRVDRRLQVSAATFEGQPGRPGLELAIQSFDDVVDRCSGVGDGAVVGRPHELAAALRVEAQRQP
jgi:hypothetical protein